MQLRGQLVASEEAKRAHELRVEKERTKQEEARARTAAIQSGQGIEDITYSERPCWRVN